MVNVKGRPPKLVRHIPHLGPGGLAQVGNSAWSLAAVAAIVIGLTSVRQSLSLKSGCSSVSPPTTDPRNFA